MIPRSERYKVSDYFNLDVVGEAYDNSLGELTDLLSEYAVEKTDIGKNVVICPILRAGLSMSKRLEKRLPMAQVVRVNMKRNLETLEPYASWDEFDKISHPEEKRLIITDPALATGGSFLKAIELATKHGFKDKDIIIMAMFGGPMGIERLGKEHPEIKIYLVHMADGMREDGYLLPYNGDTGDRLFGIRDN
jgi:uracil phosphoribosyltransferase